jgi:hypothetical protein
MKRVALVGIAVLALGGGSAQALRLPSAPNCPIFPANNPWNERVDKLPVAANSVQMIASIGVDTGLHPDFGSGLYDGQRIGIPFDIVSKSTPRAHLSFDYADESDKVGYPIPTNVHIEGGSDHHAILIDKSACRLYELFALQRTGSGWTAGSGATWNLRSNHVRPAGWTSADAAGLPIFPGLARYDEVARGVIDHALRFTAARTRRAFVYPARHYASSSDDPSLPPMGLRVRLKASFDLSQLSPQARVVAVALQHYGMILADNGSPWYVSGVSNKQFSDDDLRTLNRITGRDLEVVDTSGLVNTP